MYDIFRVVSTKTGNIIEDGFVNKQDAKQKRNELNESFNKKREKNDPFRKLMFIVMRGKDHRLGPSPIPKNLWTFYNKQIPIYVTKETIKFYENKRKGNRKKIKLT